MLPSSIASAVVGGVAHRNAPGSSVAVKQPIPESPTDSQSASMAPLNGPPAKPASTALQFASVPSLPANVRVASE